MNLKGTYYTLCFHSVLSENGPWREVVSETLEDSRQQKDPLPMQEFPFPAQAGRYVKLVIVSYYGAGGGVQFFDIIGESKEKVCAR